MILFVALYLLAGLCSALWLAGELERTPVDTGGMKLEPGVYHLTWEDF
jgi:hypothetical protein